MSQPHQQRGSTPEAPEAPAGDDPAEQVPAEPVTATRPPPPPRPNRAGPVYQPPPSAVEFTPTAIKVSFWLWIGTFLAVLTAMALSASDVTELRSRLRRLITEQDPDLAVERLDRLVNLSLFGVLTGVVALTVLLALVAAYMRLHRRWARIVLTVLSVLALPVLIATWDVVEPLARLSLLVAAALFVPALVCMFLPRANEWFRR